MTEQEWLACQNPREMVLWTRRSNGNTASRNFQITNRQYRMYACACCLLAGTSVEIVNEYEENGLNDPTYGPRGKQYDDSVWGLGWTEVGQNKPTMKERADLLRCILGNPFKRIVRTGHEIYYGDGTHGQDYFITPTVKSIAQKIYNDRDWDALPILADALEDAGCSMEVQCQECGGAGGYQTYQGHGNVESSLCERCGGIGLIPNPILTHLRAPGPHARGCHVLDLILGKE